MALIVWTIVILIMAPFIGLALWLTYWLMRMLNLQGPVEWSLFLVSPIFGTLAVLFDRWRRARRQKAPHSDALQAQTIPLKLGQYATKI